MAERVGRVSVDVSPEFDQAELFRQVRAAAKGIPSITLQPKILAKDVNKAIREVNQKKLVAINLSVSISRNSVNKAITERNKDSAKAKLLVDVKFSRAQIKKALKEAQAGLSIGGTGKEGKKLVAEEAANAKAKGLIWKNAVRQYDANEKTRIFLGKKWLAASVAFEKQTQNERAAAWAVAARRYTEIERARIAATRRLASRPINFTSNLTSLSRSLQGFERSVGRMLRTTGFAFTAWGIGVTAAVAAVTAASVVNFAKFEKSARNAASVFSELEPGFNKIINANERLTKVTEVTAKTMQAARKASLQSTFSAGDEAEGLFFLASAGVRAADSFAQISNISKFAQAGVFDITQASELLLQAVNATGEGMSNLGKVSDLLTEANLRSQTTLEDLAKALTNRAGAAFKLFKRPVSETIGLLQEFGNVGVTGMEAGTQLSIVIREIARSASGASVKGQDAVKLFKQLGINALDANGNLTNVGGILDQLAAKFKNYSTRKQVLTLRDLGITERASAGIRRLIVRSNALQEQHSSLAKEIIKLNNTAAGSTNRIAAEQLAGVSAQFSLLKNNVVALSQVFAGPIAFALTKFVKKLTDTTVEGTSLFERFQSKALELGTSVAKNISDFISSVKLEDLKNLFNGLLDSVKLTLMGVKLFFVEFSKGLGGTGEAGSIFKSIGDAARIMGQAFAEIAPIVGRVFGEIIGFVRDHPDITKLIIAATLATYAFSKTLSIIIIPLLRLRILLGALALEIPAVAAGMRILGALLIPGGQILLAIGATAAGFLAVYNNSKLFREGSKIFSDSVLFIFPGLRTGIELLSDFALKLGGIEAQTEGISLKGFNSAIQTAKKISAGLTKPKVNKNTPFGPAVPAGFWKEQRRAAAEAKQAADLKKLISDLGGATDNNLGGLGGEGAKRAKSAADKIAMANNKVVESVEFLRHKIPALDAAFVKHKNIIDKVTESIEALKGAQLLGTKAFDDQTFAIDQQIKALELQQVNLKIGGAKENSGPIVDLQKQIDALQLQSQKVDLTKSLQLDPLKKKFDETINPIKEISFDSAISQFNSLTATLKNSQAQMATLEGAARKQIGKPFKAAAADINKTLMDLPKTAGPGVQTSVIWAGEVGKGVSGALTDGLKTGIRDQLKPKSDFHTLLHEEIPAFIKANKGPVAYDRGILVPAGTAIMEGLTTGLRRGFEPVKGYLKTVGPSMEEYVPDSMFGQKTAEFLVDVAAGKKPDPKKFFADLMPSSGVMNIDGGIMDPRLGFLHKTESLADTTMMAKSLAKTFGLQVTALKYDHNQFTASGNTSDHFKGLAADLSNGTLTQEEDNLTNALRPLFGTIIKQLIFRNKDQNRGFPVPGHLNHVHVAFLPSANFDLLSGKIGSAFNPGGVGKGAFAGIIHAASKAFGVPQNLIRAIIQAESNFNPNAGSGAGAKGLMQLIPSTFASQKVGNDIFDPRQNIFAGTKYLSALLHHFPLPLAVAGYNAGGGAVQKYGGIPPFAETIAYVKKVLGFLKQFGGFKATGGAVNPNNWYMTGERGPEPFIPHRPGFIMSNDRMDRMISAMEANAKNTANSPAQSSISITTASKDPEVLMALLEARERRRIRKMDIR